MSEQQIPELNIGYEYPVSESPIECLSVRSHNEFRVTLLLALGSITGATLNYCPGNI